MRRSRIRLAPGSKEYRQAGLIGQAKRPFLLEHPRTEDFCRRSLGSGSREQRTAVIVLSMDNNIRFRICGYQCATRIEKIAKCGEKT